MKLKILLAVLSVVLLVMSLLFVRSKFVKSYQELEEARLIISNQQHSDQYLDFLKKFIKLVINSEGEISFEARLELENSVKEIGDKQLLEAWQRFIGSVSESEAQKNVRELLEILVSRI